MDRSSFHKIFKTIGPVVLPVVHVLDEKQAWNNILVAMREGAQGVFLINHDFSYHKLLPILIKMRSDYPSLWMGVNFLGLEPGKAFKVLNTLAEQGCQIDGYWADNAGIDERVSLKEQVTADGIEADRKASGWKGLYFGGTAFKYQRYVDDNVLGRAAEYASSYMDVVTTSGSGTGVAATLKRISDMRNGIEDKALALASGVTPQNASSYASFVDCFLVATGISANFHNLNPLLVRALVTKCRGNLITISPSIKDEDKDWHLSLMAGNGNPSLDKETVLDFSCVYSNGTAFKYLVNDLVTPVRNDIPNVDLIVGFDGSGAPLAVSVASNLGKGFIMLSKKNLLREATELEGTSVNSQVKSVVQAGVNVAIIDMCMDDVSVLKGAISSIERQGGTVVVLMAICIKRNPATLELYQKYFTYDIVPADLKEKYNQPYIKFS